MTPCSRQVIKIKYKLQQLTFDILKACIVGKLIVPALPPVSHNRLLHGSIDSESPPKGILNQF